MQKGRGGSIVNVASVPGIKPFARAAAYGVGKACFNFKNEGRANVAGRAGAPPGSGRDASGPAGREKGRMKTWCGRNPSLAEDQPCGRCYGCWHLLCRSG
jgi:hypothetical protein